MDVASSGTCARSRTGPEGCVGTVASSDNAACRDRSCMAQAPPPQSGRLRLPPRSAPCCEPPSSCFTPVAGPHSLPVHTEDGHWDNDWDHRCSQPLASGCPPWLDAEPLSPTMSPAGSSLDARVAATSSSGDDLQPSSYGRQLGVAGYFSAWLKGECPALSAATGESSVGALAPLAGGLAESLASAAASPEAEDATPTRPSSPMQLRAGVTAATVAAADPLQIADAASSLSSPVGSDCRTTPDECSSYESGRSCSLSLLSWDALSSSSNGGGSGDDQEVDNGGTGWTALEPAASAAAGECALPVRVVECDLWERELEVKLSSAARRSGGAALAAAAPADVLTAPPCDLAAMVRVVVTEALFDP